MAPKMAANSRLFVFVALFTAVWGQTQDIDVPLGGTAILPLGDYLDDANNPVGLSFVRYPDPAVTVLSWTPKNPVNTATIILDDKDHMYVPARLLERLSLIDTPSGIAAQVENVTLNDTGKLVFYQFHQTGHQGPKMYINIIAPPPAVASFDITDVGEDFVNVTWLQVEPLDSAPVKYYVEYRETDGSSDNWHQTAHLNETDEKDNLAMRVEGLFPALRYDFRVVAANRFNKSHSPTKEVLTAGLPSRSTLGPGGIAAIIIVVVVLAVLAVVAAVVQFRRSRRNQNPSPDPVQDPDQDPVQDPAQDPVQDPAQDPVQGPVQDPVQGPDHNPVQDPDQRKNLSSSVNEILEKVFKVCQDPENFEAELYILGIAVEAAVLSIYSYKPILQAKLKLKKPNSDHLVSSLSKEVFSQTKNRDEAWLKVKFFNNFCAILKKIEDGCVLCTLEFDNVSHLKSFLRSYRDGKLSETLTQDLITDEMKQKDGPDLRVHVTLHVARDTASSDDEAAPELPPATYTRRQSSADASNDHSILDAPQYYSVPGGGSNNVEGEPDFNSGRPEENLPKLDYPDTQTDAIPSAGLEKAFEYRVALYYDKKSENEKAIRSIRAKLEEWEFLVFDEHRDGDGGRMDTSAYSVQNCRHAIFFLPIKTNMDKFKFDVFQANTLKGDYSIHERSKVLISFHDDDLVNTIESVKVRLADAEALPYGEADTWRKLYRQLAIPGCSFTVEEAKRLLAMGADSMSVETLAEKLNIPKEVVCDVGREFGSDMAQKGELMRLWMGKEGPEARRELEAISRSINGATSKKGTRIAPISDDVTSETYQPSSTVEYSNLLAEKTETSQLDNTNGSSSSDDTEDQATGPRPAAKQEEAGASQPNSQQGELQQSTAGSLDPSPQDDDESASLLPQSKSDSEVSEGEMSINVDSPGHVQKDEATPLLSQTPQPDSEVSDEEEMSINVDSPGHVQKDNEATPLLSQTPQPGRDWRLLAEEFDYNEYIPLWDQQAGKGDLPAEKLLKCWETKSEATVGRLEEVLLHHNMGTIAQILKTEY